MAEQFLNRPDIVVGLQQVACKTVPECMRRGPLADSCRFHGTLDGFLHKRFVQMITPVFSGRLNQAVARVAEVMKMAPEEVTAFRKSPQTVKDRALLCFWANRKVGLSTVEIAGKLKISQPALSRSSKRGENIERENYFELVSKRIKT